MKNWGLSVSSTQSRWQFIARTMVPLSCLGGGGCTLCSATSRLAGMPPYIQEPDWAILKWIDEHKLWGIIKGSGSKVRRFFDYYIDLADRGERMGVDYRRFSIWRRHGAIEIRGDSCVVGQVFKHSTGWNYQVFGSAIVECNYHSMQAAIVELVTP